MHINHVREKREPRLTFTADRRLRACEKAACAIYVLARAQGATMKNAISAREIFTHMYIYIQTL